MEFSSEEIERRREERDRERKFMAAQMNALKIGAIVAAVVMVTCVAAILIASGIAANRRPGELASQPTTQPTEPAPTLPDTVITLVAGGDVNVTDKVVSAGLTPQGYNYADIFLDVMPVIAGADVSVVNFEGVLAGAPYNGQSAPQELMQALKDVGVDLVQTANTKSISKGPLGLKSTLDGAYAAGLLPVGTFYSNDEFAETGGFTIIEVQGIRIAFVAFTKGMGVAKLPKGYENCVNLLYKDYTSTYQEVDKEGIKSVLKKVAAQKPDVTVAMLHWGSEYNDKKSDSQKTIVKLMQDNGVDAILGTHPHYVQEMEFDPDAGTFVAWSLGDLLGDAAKAGTNYSVLLELEITKDGDTGAVSITGYHYVPVFLEDTTADGGKLRLLRIEEAMASYQNNAVNRVSEQTYKAMVNALERIEDRVKG